MSGGCSVCNEFGRNFPNAFLHQEKSVKSGDVDERKRKQKVKVFYRERGLVQTRATAYKYFYINCKGLTLNHLNLSDS